MPERIKRLRISFMWKETSRNSMVFFKECAGFVFISIDSDKPQVEHLNAPSLPTPNFSASFARKLHPREGDKTPWELSPQLSAFGMTFTADY